MITPTERPIFVPKYRPDQGGNDFLGLRAVNTALMGECLPGINNVSQHLRPFSLIAWIFWKFYHLAGSANIKSPTSEQQRIWQEKIEVLFTWSHVLNGVQGIPGTRANAPPGPRVPLDFASWKRKLDSTSLLAAIQYGPPAKSTYGLSFIEETESGLLRTTGNGIELAEALDHSLNGVGRRKLLQQIGKASATSSEVAELYRHWTIQKPTAREKRAFRAAFYSEADIGNGSRTAFRSATVSLLLGVLKSARVGLTVDEIRNALFHGMVLQQRTSSVPSDLAMPWHRWICLQVRQAQRLAMESLLGWVERRLMYTHDRDTRSMVTYIKELWDKDGHILPVQGTIAGVQNKLAVDNLQKFLQRSHQSEDQSLLALMDKILQAFDANDDTHVLHALRVLFLCAEAAKHLADTGTIPADLALGGPERISLRYWLDTTDRCGDLKRDEFILLLLEQHIVSQHLSVAARRYDGGTQRLRISIEEEGMTSLVNEVLPLRVTPDRLGTALSLMSECEMIDFDAATGTYTTNGSSAPRVAAGRTGT